MAEEDVNKMENRQKNARALALDVLTRCESGGYSNIALDTVIKRNDLTSSDRALMTALIYGVIERKIAFTNPFERLLARETVSLSAACAGIFCI